MNYHRFESILAAASPFELASPTSSSPCGLIQDVTTTDGLPEEAVAAATGHDNDSFQPFRRAHSMRSSFTSLRGLRTRLKQPPTVAATKYSPLLSPGRCSVAADHHHQQHQHPTPTLTTTAAAVAKANVKAKLLRLKETYAEFRRMQSSSSQVANVPPPTVVDLQKCCSANFKIPENMPPKAAAVLLEGGSSARTAGRRAVQRTQSLKVAAVAEPPRYGAIIGGGGSLRKSVTGGGKLTVRKTVSVPPVEQKQQQQVGAEDSGENKDGQCLKVARTATIRRSSVWANSSSSSKIV